MRVYAFLIAATTLCLCAFVRAETAPNLPEKHFEFLSNYCLDCHDALTEKGSVNLEDLSFLVTNIEEAELWQKVLNTMNSGEMPPEDKKQPEEGEKADFLDALAQTMVDARRSLSDTGGEITMRRLNRREYQNSMASLLGFKPDVSSLPADGGSGTFDTVGSSQFISSDQIEQYLKLGRSAINEWLQRQATIGLESKTFRVEPENTVNMESRKAIKTLEDIHQRFLAWKAEVDKAIAAPENREIMTRLLKENPDFDPSTYPSAGGLRFYRNASELIGSPDPKAFRFTDDNQAVFSVQGGYGRTHAYRKQYLEFPNSDQGTYLKLAWGIQRIDVTPDPKDLQPGTYKLRLRAGSVEGSEPSRHFIEVGHPQRVNQVPYGFTTKPIASLQVTGTEENPEIIETTVVINSDTPREFGIQERVPADSKKNISREFYRYKAENGYGTPPAIWVDWVELVGPIPDNAAVESTITRIEPEKTINPDNEKEIANIEDAQARSAEWQKGVDAVINTPANQAKIAEIRKTEPKIDHPQWGYAYADRLEGTPDATKFGFRDAQKAAASDPKGDRANLAYHKHYASLPHRDRGTYLKLAHGTGRVIVASEELPPGTYTLRVAAAAVEDSPASRHFIEVGHPQRLIESRNWGLEGQPISSHQVTGTIKNPQVIEIPLEVGTDTIKEFAIQEKQPNTGNLKELWDAHNAFKKENGFGHPPAIWIDWVELEGPHGAAPSASDRDDSWFTEAIGPDDSSRARTIFEQFAFKAFRGVEAEDEFIDRLAAIYDNRRAAGDSFEHALELPLAVILSSPGFLYLNEPVGDPTNDANERRELNSRELAVRLAYFLWSAPPDQELFDRASHGELSNPDILRSQVDRLIADSRSDEFVAGFLHQWLHMERLDFFQFDTRLYRDLPPRQTAQERLRLRQRAARDLLRARRRHWRPIPKGRPARRVTTWRLVRHGRGTRHGQRRHRIQPRRTRRLGVAIHPQRSPSPGSAERAAAFTSQRRSPHHPPEVGGSHGRSSMRQLPPQDRPDRLRSGELQRRRQVAHGRRSWQKCSSHRPRRPVTQRAEVQGLLRAARHHRRPRT